MRMDMMMRIRGQEREIGRVWQTKKGMKKSTVQRGGRNYKNSDYENILEYKKKKKTEYTNKDKNEFRNIDKHTAKLNQTYQNFYRHESRGQKGRDVEEQKQRKRRCLTVRQQHSKSTSCGVSLHMQPRKM